MTKASLDRASHALTEATRAFGRAWLHKEQEWPASLHAWSALSQAQEAYDLAWTLHSQARAACKQEAHP
jgi:hypothetical protein